MRLVILIFCLLFSTTLFAGDAQKVKDGLIDRFTSGLSEAVENILDGEGDTQVRIDMGEDYKPEFSIVTVRPIAIHHSVDATFIQLQLSDHKIKIPMYGKIDSLNVSNSASIILYEIIRQKLF